MVYIIGGKDHQIIRGEKYLDGIKRKIDLLREETKDLFEENITLYYISGENDFPIKLKEKLNPMGINVISLNNPNLEELLNGITKSELSEKVAGFIISKYGFQGESLKRIREFIPKEMDVDCKNPQFYSDQETPFFYPVVSEASVRILTEVGIGINDKSIGIVGNNKISRGLQKILHQNFKPACVSSVTNSSLDEIISESNLLFITENLRFNPQDIKQSGTIVYSLGLLEHKQDLELEVQKRAKFVADVKEFAFGILAEHAYKAYIYNTIKNAPEEIFLRTRRGLYEGIISLLKNAKGRGVPTQISERHKKWKEKKDK